MKQLLAAGFVAAVIAAVAFVGCNKKNEAPDVPNVPAGPSNGRPDTTYIFTSSATDPDGDSVAIRFDWGDGDTSDWSDWAASGESIQRSHSWSEPGGYYIAAQARDLREATSLWSGGRHVTIGNPPGTPATPVGDSTGTVDATYSFFSTATDPDGDSVAIRFDWGDGDTSDWSFWAAGGDSISTTHSWSDSGSYSIRAQAKDAGNAVSAWSSGHQLVISGGSGSGWIRTFGGSSNNIGRSVDACSDGGYIIVGYADPGGDKDVYLVKTDSQGNSQWWKAIGGASEDIGYSIVQTPDGGFTFVGSTMSWGCTHGKLLLVSTDAQGDTLWTKRYGYSDCANYGRSVQQTEDGGYVVVGATNDENDPDFYLVKTDANGNKTWLQQYGGSNSDIGYSVQQTRDGGYILAGVSSSHGAGSGDMIIYKTDPEGNYSWHKTHGGSDWDGAYSVQQTGDGGYVIAGETSSSGSGGEDVYLVKTDTGGNPEWASTFGGAADDVGESVLQTLDGGYIIAGWTKSFGAGGSDVYLVKTNAWGDTVWTRTYGGPGDDCAYSVCRSYDSYIVAGYTTTDAGDKDVILIKVDANGNVE